MGYYLEDLVEHNFFRPKTNDYWEMNLHHLLTIGLFSGMILLNVVRSGAIVSFLHNVSDIPTTSSRILSQTVFKKATNVSAGLMILVWFLFRNIAIPIFCIGCWYNLILPPVLQQYQFGVYVLNFYMTLMCCMHVYWLILLSNMVFKGLKSGSTEDLRSKLVVKKAN